MTARRRCQQASGSAGTISTWREAMALNCERPPSQLDEFSDINAIVAEEAPLMSDMKKDVVNGGWRHACGDFN